MTDDHRATDEEDGDLPDGFILVHIPPNGDSVYGIGPFPPFEELADKLIEAKVCDCDVSLLWLQFPAGIRMQVAADPNNVAAALMAVIAEEEEPSTRLN